MKKRIPKVIAGILALALVLVLVVGCAPASAPTATTPEDDYYFESCSSVFAGKDATVDGSVIGAQSLDGPYLGRVRVFPAADYKPGTMMDIVQSEKPYTYEQYLEYLEREPVWVGEIPQAEHTYRYVGMRISFEELQHGGVNEYGLTLLETTIGGRGELKTPNAWMQVYSEFDSSDLFTIALQRAKTAKEAIQVIGDLAEEYGYRLIPYTPLSGEHLTINDGNELWAFEIFGVGEWWTQGCGEPGAVWCAQRIPDGHVGVSANRSRIGEVPLEENDYFMFSDNIRDLAEDMEWWNGVEPFVWYEAYAPSERRSSMIREWRALSLLAPSLGLPPPPSTGDQRYPFSVKPDKKVSVQDIMAVMRDTLEGTPYDATEDPAFIIPSGPNAGQKSVVACSFGHPRLHELLEVSPERTIACAKSTMTVVGQVRADLPDPIKGCFWYGWGNAASTCYVPIYSGVTELPESCGYTSFNEIHRDEAFWPFNLVDLLSWPQYQMAKDDIAAVRDPAEACFFIQQPEMEDAVVDLYNGRGEVGAKNIAEKLVTKYSCACMNAAVDGYWELVDYMLFKYNFVSSGFNIRGESASLFTLPPSIDCPPVPTNPGHHCKGGGGGGR